MQDREKMRFDRLADAVGVDCACEIAQARVGYVDMESALQSRWLRRAPELLMMSYPTTAHMPSKALLAHLNWLNDRLERRVSTDQIAIATSTAEWLATHGTMPAVVLDSPCLCMWAWRRPQYDLFMPLRHLVLRGCATAFLLCARNDACQSRCSTSTCRVPFWSCVLSQAKTTAARCVSCASTLKKPSCFISLVCQRRRSGQWRSETVP